MSVIWENKENTLDVPSSSKAILSARKHSVKKQAFGELKNIINQRQISSTPLKGGPLKSDIFIDTSKSLFKDVLKKQQAKQNFNDAKQKLHKQLKNKNISPDSNNEIDEIYEFDIPNQCCNENCKKRDMEIWNEMDAFGDSFFDKVLNTDYSHEELQTEIAQISYCEDDDTNIAADEDVNKFLHSQSLIIELQLPDISDIISALPNI